jgi:hypothetical protein
MSTDRPSIRLRCLWRTNSAFSSVANRSSRPLPSSIGVLRFLTKRSGHHSRSNSCETCLPNSADWLNRFFSSRDQCRGTGATSMPGFTMPCALFTIQRAAVWTISKRSPCFSPSTILRPLAVYNSAARPWSHGRVIFKHSSQSTALFEEPGSGAPHRSQTRPSMKYVSFQQGPHRPKSLSTERPQQRQRGGYSIWRAA